MNHLPEQVKFLFLIALIILMMFAGFIVMVVMVYKKKQLVFQKERLLKDIQYRNQLLEKELEIQRKVQEERERISHDMHDDLGAGISALKLQAEFIKQKVDDQSIKADVDDLLKTAGEMNLSMREMLWSLNSTNDNLGNFMQYVVQYAEGFFKKTEIKVSVRREVDSPETKLSSEMRRNLFLCAKESLNNIYKHSKANEVYITFNLNADEVFTMQIVDNGVGFYNNQNSGYGLQNMQKRMNDVGGKYEICNSEKGVCLYFVVKI
jgi:two-component system sensor histidine kinase DesK